MPTKAPLLVFSRPITYFGASQQHWENEIDDIECGADLFRIGLENDLLFPFQQHIGLFLYWSEIP
jgi:hypothetical protein